MPLLHQPKPLRTQVLATIANNFENLCYGCYSHEQMRRLIDTDEYLKMKGPFAELPPDILEDMAEEMKHVTHLRRHHLNIFITPHLKVWSSHGVGDQLIAFDMLSKRCKNLKVLNISYTQHISPKHLLQLLPSLCNIVILNLKMTLAVDQMMYHIGHQCLNLVELNISRTPVSDRGLVQLCISEEGVYQCQKLSKLVVSESSNITSKGAAVALRSLPNLRNFDFDDIFEAVESTEKWDQDMEYRVLSDAGIRLNTAWKPVYELALQTLISAAEYVRNESVDSAMRLCPETTTVILSNAWLPNEVLYKLMLLKNLVSISITNSEGLTLDFYDGVLPLLSACGHALQNLILANFTNVDITEIGKSCPLLQNLALSSVAHYEPVFKPCEDYFTNLEVLEIWSNPEAEISHNTIKQCITFSKKIHRLLFKGWTNLSDNFLEDIWQVNSMKGLAHLTLNQCHNVTSAVLHRLFDMKNNLAVVRVWACLNIAKSHYIGLKERIKSENLDVYFEWFPYEE